MFSAYFLNIIHDYTEALAVKIRMSFIWQESIACISTVRESSKRSGIRGTRTQFEMIFAGVLSLRIHEIGSFFIPLTFRKMRKDWLQERQATLWRPAQIATNYRVVCKREERDEERAVCETKRERERKQQCFQIQKSYCKL